MSLMQALNYLHDTQGIVHRDLKPDNLLVEGIDDEHKRCYIRITGFSFATTKPKGEKVGTVPYMAPEVFKGELYDTKVDIWSAGVIAFYLFTGGYLPFDLDEDHKEDSDSYEVIKNKVLYEEPQWDWLDGASPLVVPFIKSLLTKDPKRRPTAN